MRDGRNSGGSLESGSTPYTLQKAPSPQGSIQCMVQRSRGVLSERVNPQNHVRSLAMCWHPETWRERDSWETLDCLVFCLFVFRLQRRWAKQIFTSLSSLRIYSFSCYGNGPGASNFPISAQLLCFAHSVEMPKGCHKTSQDNIWFQRHANLQTLSRGNDRDILGRKQIVFVSRDKQRQLEMFLPFHSEGCDGQDGRVRGGFSSHGTDHAKRIPKYPRVCRPKLVRLLWQAQY